MTVCDILLGSMGMECMAEACGAIEGINRRKERVICMWYLITQVDK